MKPKTKLQEKIVGLSGSVDPATKQQKQWANKAIFDHYYVECRNRYYCLECGHKWNPKEPKLSKYILPTACPECEEKNLNHVEGWNTDESRYEYWAIIDVVEGFQVVRMFFAEKYMKRKQPAQYSHREVMQHWIRPDGKVTSMTMLAGGMGTYNYYDAWSMGSELEVRTNSRNHRLRCSIAPSKICPGRNTLSIIRRNGYKGYFKDEAPHHFFAAILRHSKAETLLKARQISLFKMCTGHEDGIHDSVIKYWDCICIAMRNDFIIEDAGDWIDYLEALEEFNRDLKNAHYLCPDNFAAEHNRYIEKIKQKKKQQQLKEMLEGEDKYIESKKRFFDLEFEANGIKIVPLKSAIDFIEEGDKLKHCIATNRYDQKENSLMLSARIDGEPVANIEVNLSRLKVTQARGLWNKPTEYHAEIVGIVQDNMPKIAQRVTA